MVEKGNTVEIGKYIEVWWSREIRLK